MSAGRLSAAFIDRDGTLIDDPGYLHRPADVKLKDGVVDAVRRLNDAGVPVVVVTNQSGIGRGLFGVEAVEAVHREIERRLAAGGARIDAFYICPHAPDAGCACRKPGPALYERAASDFGVELDRALYVGDRARDVVVGAERGAVAIVVGGGENPPPGGASAPNLAGAVELALGGRCRDSSGES